MTHPIETTVGELRDIVNTLKPVLDRRSKLPILGCIRFHDGTAEVTDLDMSASIQIAMAQDTDIVVSHGDLHKWLTGLPKESAVTIGCDDDTSATLQCDNEVFTLERRKSAEFPEMDFAADDVRSVIAPVKVLADAFKLANPCISDDDDRYYIQGVFMERDPDGGAGFNFVSTDGYRMCVVNEQIRGTWHDVILPKKTALYLQSKVFPKADGDVVMVNNGERVAITVGGIKVIAKAIDGDFPDYRRIQPSNPDYAMMVDVKAAENASARIAKMNAKHGKKMLISDGKFSCQAGKSSLTISVDMQQTDLNPVDFTLAYNAEYVHDIAKSLSEFGDDMTLSTHGQTEPARFVCSGKPGVQFVLMPIRV